MVLYIRPVVVYNLKNGDKLVHVWQDAGYGQAS